MDMQVFDFKGFHARKYLFEPAVKSPELTSIFALELGAQHGHKIGAIEELRWILREVMDCDIPEYKGFKISERCVDLRSVGFNIPFCYKKFANTLFAELLADGVDVYDIELASPALTGLIMRQVQRAIGNDIWDVSVWGNPTVAHSFFKNATGLLGYHIPELIGTGGTNSMIPAFDITAPVTVGDGTMLAQLNAIYDNSTEELKSYNKGDLRWLLSPESADAVARDLEAIEGSANGAAAYVDGRYIAPPLIVSGVVVTRDNSAVAARAATGVTARYQSLLLVHGNAMVQSDSGNFQNQIRARTDHDSRKYKVKGEFLLDSNFYHPALFSYGADNI